MALTRQGRVKRKTKGTRSMLVHVFYGIIAIGCVVLIATLVWYLTRLPAVTITSIAIEGGETVSHDILRKEIEEVLSGNYILLIPHRFIYMYPHDSIVNRINEIPRVHDATVERQNGNELQVKFMEYVPEALWCSGEGSEEACYFIDAAGYAFAPAPPLEGGSLVRHIFEESPALEERQILPSETLSDLTRFVAVLDAEFGFRVKEVFHTRAGDVEYRLNGGGTLLVAPSQDIEDTYENLKSILDSEKFSYLEPGNFNYIDLRFGNKVFVKEEFDTATTTEESKEPQSAAQ